MKDIVTQGLQEMGITPPDGAVDKLVEYGRLLLEQNKVMNLTAITEPDQVARLHFLDSAAILKWDAEQRGAGGRTTAPTWLANKTVIDVGTGAGFPGMVLKILEPSISLTLVDSLGKRVVWLEKVCEALSLDGVRCLHARAEELALDPGFRDGFDVAVSRAVAAFPALCELCLPYTKVGGRFAAMKSVESGEEVQSGQNAVKRLGGRLLKPHDYPIPGTEVTHRLVGVEKTAPTPKGLPRSWGKIKKSPL
ncbi:MAG: 16S rRNA (guanine(527)-N(7))-methyltransferase RsmG [Oscillospiraceae bacterium]|nr:16S rRNA (guanine(527)-N(7))-methyltransferase RsmG [Oscillospiraceae bacterium]